MGSAAACAPTTDAGACSPTTARPTGADAVALSGCCMACLIRSGCAISSFSICRPACATNALRCFGRPNLLARFNAANRSSFVWRAFAIGKASGGKASSSSISIRRRSAWLTRCCGILSLSSTPEKLGLTAACAARCVAIKNGFCLVSCISKSRSNSITALVLFWISRITSRLANSTSRFKSASSLRCAACNACLSRSLFAKASCLICATRSSSLAF